MGPLTVNRLMFGRRDELKIFGPVVGWITVPVVNLHPRRDWSPVRMGPDNPRQIL